MRDDSAGNGRSDGASEDSEASRGAGGSSSRPGGSPRGDAGRVDGRGKADDGRVEGDLEDKAEAPVDHAGAARLRRELREAKARLKELEESRAAPATTTTTPEKKADAEVVSDPEPNKAANPQAWNEWRIRALEKTITDKIAPIEKTYQVTEEQRVANERISGAVNEFKQIRDEYIQKNPDFVPAFTHGYNKVTEAYALMNPSWSKERIVKEADWQMLQFASDCARKGINPAEALYDLSIERFGYKPGQAKAAKETRAQPRAQEAQDDAEPAPQREKPRADLRTIDRNRKRSVTPLARGGQSGSSRLTKESVANMTNGELLNLDPADWDALERLEG